MGDIVVATFQTRSGTIYRTYFYPAFDYTLIDYGQFQDFHIIKEGFYFGFTKTYEYSHIMEPIDCKVRNTIIEIVKQFFLDYGQDKILLVHCDNQDKKHGKRAKAFDYWYKLSSQTLSFTKKDEELVVNQYDIDGNLSTETDYLSIIISNDNMNREEVLNEFQSIKETLISNKM